MKYFTGVNDACCINFSEFKDDEKKGMEQLFGNFSIFFGVLYECTAKINRYR
jgi:hypothetical protein